MFGHIVPFFFQLLFTGACALRAFVPMHFRHQSVLTQVPSAGVFSAGATQPEPAPHPHHIFFNSTVTQHGGQQKNWNTSRSQPDARSFHSSPEPGNSGHYAHSYSWQDYHDYDYTYATYSGRVIGSQYEHMNSSHHARSYPQHSNSSHDDAEGDGHYRNHSGPQHGWHSSFGYDYDHTDYQHNEDRHHSSSGLPHAGRVGIAMNTMILRTSMAVQGPHTIDTAAMGMCMSIMTTPTMSITTTARHRIMVGIGALLMMITTKYGLMMAVQRCKMDTGIAQVMHMAISGRTVMPMLAILRTSSIMAVQGRNMGT